MPEAEPSAEMATVSERLEEASIACFVPVTLLINFSLFQYLLVIYYKRRREYHGFLLLLCAALGFVALIPFASVKGERAGHMNDISETASIVTFLVQITIVSRDVTKKMRLPSLRYMMFASELFTLFALVVLIVNMLEIAGLDMQAFDGVDNIAENLSLAFIFISRFAFLGMARGWRYLIDNKKLEMAMYALFLTHEYPFAILEAETGVSWEALQAVWHRLTMAMCISLTLKEKFRSSIMSKDRTRHTTTQSQGPTDRTMSSFKFGMLKSHAVRPAPMANNVPDRVNSARPSLIAHGKSGNSSRPSITSFRVKRSGRE